MGKASSLLQFLLDNNFTIRRAIEILENAENKIISRRKEKAINQNYEKRGGSHVLQD